MAPEYACDTNWLSPVKCFFNHHGICRENLQLQGKDAAFMQMLHSLDRCHMDLDSKWASVVEHTADKAEFRYDGRELLRLKLCWLFGDRPHLDCALKAPERCIRPLTFTCCPDWCQVDGRNAHF
jgi:hypothetical protein